MSSFKFHNYVEPAKNLIIGQITIMKKYSVRIKMGIKVGSSTCVEIMRWGGIVVCTVTQS